MTNPRTIHHAGHIDQDAHSIPAAEATESGGSAPPVYSAASPPAPMLSDHQFRKLVDRLKDEIEHRESCGDAFGHAMISVTEMRYLVDRLNCSRSIITSENNVHAFRV